MKPALLEFFRQLLAETVQISLTLFRIMIPIIIAVKILQEFGAIAAVGKVLSPVMRIVGLPGSMGLVWATAILSNIYTGIIVFVSVSANESLTVAQTTVLATMMLVAHNLPIELRIAQKAGARLRFMGLLRMGAPSSLDGRFLESIVGRACSRSKIPLDGCRVSTTPRS